MAKPRNREALLQQSANNYEQLTRYIAQLDEPEQAATFPPGTMNRNIRDVLAHLYHWHLLFLDWYAIGMDGQKPPMPAEGYTWKTTPELNAWIWQQYQGTGLDKVKGLLSVSHQHVHAIIAQHSNEELFEKKRYPWTGTTSLAAYLTGATSSHYAWAHKLIQKARKTRSKQG